MSEAPKVFADIDGVFNHARLYAALAARRGTTTPVDWLDPVCLARMNTVCDATGAELVISSAWPSYVGGLDAVVTILRAAGLTAPVVGATPEANPLPLEDPHRTRKGRGYEIRAWLRAHPRVTNYVDRRRPEAHAGGLVALRAHRPRGRVHRRRCGEAAASAHARSCAWLTRPKGHASPSHPL